MHYIFSSRIFKSKFWLTLNEVVVDAQKCQMVALVMLELCFCLIRLELLLFRPIEAIVGRGEHCHNCDNLEGIKRTFKI
jgi:hypothetical protein